LKAIEGSGLRNLDLSAEIRCQVFQDNAVTCLGGLLTQTAYLSGTCAVNRSIHIISKNLEL
jgi:hypothetical protein